MSGVKWSYRNLLEFHYANCPFSILSLSDLWVKFLEFSLYRAVALQPGNASCSLTSSSNRVILKFPRVFCGFNYHLGFVSFKYTARPTKDLPALFLGTWGHFLLDKRSSEESGIFVPLETKDKRVRGNAWETVFCHFTLLWESSFKPASAPSKSHFRYHSHISLIQLLPACISFTLH